MTVTQKQAPYSINDFDISNLNTTFDPEKHPISQLSLGVYKITSNGHEFVARIPTFNKGLQIGSGNARREAFINSLLEQMPLPFLTEIKLLDISDSRKIIATIKNYWGHDYSVAPDARVSIVPLHQGTHGNRYLDNIDMKKASVEEIKQKIPENIRIQLSNYWAIYTVFRIVDFHAANWILSPDHQTVIPIDFAWDYNPKDKVKDNILALNNQQQPFGSRGNTNKANQTQNVFFAK